MPPISVVLAAMFAISAAPPVLAQSAVNQAVDTLKTIGDVNGIEGRWIWANKTTIVDLNDRSAPGLVEKMERFCPEERSPVMSVEAAENGFNIGVANSPPGLHWQYRRDRFGAYTRSVDPTVFYPALGYSDEKPPGEDIIAVHERDNGPVVILRPAADVLLITNRNGFDMFVRCDDR